MEIDEVRKERIRIEYALGPKRIIAKEGAT